MPRRKSAICGNTGNTTATQGVKDIEYLTTVPSTLEMELTLTHYSHKEYRRDIRNKDARILVKCI